MKNACLTTALFLMSLGSQAAPNISKAYIQISSAHKLTQTLSQEIVKVSKNQKSYWVYFFASEHQNLQAFHSHTFASFVEVDTRGEQSWHTISWLPSTYGDDQSICIFNHFSEAFVQTFTGITCKAVEGKNYSLLETLSWGLGKQKSVAAWGPYPITENFFLESLRRKAQLDRGDLLYLADDRYSRVRKHAVNCMHAISDIGNDPGMIANQFVYKVWGINGTKAVMKRVWQNFSEDFLDTVDVNHFKQYSR